MKLLCVSPDLPYPLDNGGRIRVYWLLKSLAERHAVQLLTFDRSGGETDRISPLREFCEEVHCVPLLDRQRREQKRRQQLRSLAGRPYQYLSNYSPLMQQAIDDRAARQRFDVVQIEFSQMGYYRLPRDVCSVLDQHNVESELLLRTFTATPWGSIRKLYSYLEWRKFRHDESAICRRFRLCVTTSARDRETLALRAPATRFAVVPNGVDNAYFGSETTDQPDEPTIVFTGTINYHPNTAGLLSFLKEVFPLVKQRVPEIRFWIVGQNPPPEIVAYGADPSIEVTGRVDDVRGYFARAAVVVVPLQIGGGTRLKILEALASGRPVVSTSIGAEGIEVEPGRNIVIADDPQAFGEAVVELLRDPARRARLAREGRALVQERYDWKSVGARLESAIQSTLDAPRI